MLHIQIVTITSYVYNATGIQASLDINIEEVAEVLFLIVLYTSYIYIFVLHK